MNIIDNNAKAPYDATAVILGDFDGLHRAHTAIIEKAVRYAKENDCKAGVFLFEENTKKFLEKKQLSLITDNEEKNHILKKLGVDFIYKVRFDREFSEKTPEDFVAYLKDKLSIKAVFCGYDYSFGHKAAGDASMMQKMGKELGFDVNIMPQITIEGYTVSSTYIRELLENGDIRKANLFLGRRFSLGGIVERGLRNGTKLGFPTANVKCNDEIVIPMSGVYAGYSYVNGIEYKSVINVGNNPTFNAKRITVESHILDFCEDIYDKNIRVSFVERIRGDIKFNSIDELSAQINNDACEAYRILEKEEL